MRFSFFAQSAQAICAYGHSFSACRLIEWVCCRAERKLGLTFRAAKDFVSAAPIGWLYGDFLFSVLGATVRPHPIIDPLV